MTTRTLLLFALDGVLVEPGGARRLPGAAEALVKIRHSGDAVLSLLTREAEDDARRKTEETVSGMSRYLDLDVGAYGPDATPSDARRLAVGAYDCAFTVLAVTGPAPGEVTRVRAGADTVVAVAPQAQAGALRAAGADHVLSGLDELPEVLTSARTNAEPR